MNIKNHDSSTLSLIVFLILLIVVLAPRVMAGWSCTTCPDCCKDPTPCWNCPPNTRCDDDDDTTGCTPYSCTQTYQDYCQCPTDPNSITKKFFDFNNDGVFNSLTIADSCRSCNGAACQVNCAPPAEALTNYCNPGICGAECVDAATPAVHPGLNYNPAQDCGNYVLDCTSCCGCTYNPGRLTAKIDSKCDSANDKLHISGNNQYCGILTITTPWETKTVSAINKVEDYQAELSVPYGTTPGSYQVTIHGSRNSDKNQLKDTDTYPCDATLNFEVQEDYCACGDVPPDEPRRFYDGLTAIARWTNAMHNASMRQLITVILTG
jgi:hypothetical protein